MHNSTYEIITILANCKKNDLKMLISNVKLFSLFVFSPLKVLSDLLSDLSVFI